MGQPSGSLAEQVARIFITGSADGLGHLAARALVNLGHDVVLHARNPERAKQALARVPGARGALSGDLSSFGETRALAREANALGRFDAVIHNAGVYRETGLGADGVPDLVAVNTLAPYILTVLMQRPQRLIYLSSNMHFQGNPDHLPGTGRVSYADTKLHDVMLCMASARHWPEVCANAVNPGWVPTRMGGAGAPDDLQEGFETQVWLAVDDGARVSGCYFHHKKRVECLAAARDTALQDAFLAQCSAITGVQWEESA